MLPTKMILDKKPETPKYLRIKHDENDIDCLHCKIKKANDSLDEKIKSLGPTTKTTMIDASGAKSLATIKSLQVHRGRYDDVIGWSIQWS